jgi:hypothetical protein
MVILQACSLQWPQNEGVWGRSTDKSTETNNTNIYLSDFDPTPPTTSVARRGIVDYRQMDNLKSISESEALSLLRNCEERIHELEAKLELQRTYQSAINRRIIEIRRFRAPIAQLPKELLLQIFGWVGFDDPLYLSAILLVCKHWKEAVYNTPTLCRSS